MLKPLEANTEEKCMIIWFSIIFRIQDLYFITSLHPISQNIHRHLISGCLCFEIKNLLIISCHKIKTISLDIINIL